MKQNSSAEVLAAIDLGSNSFHMIIARLQDGHFQVMDRLREMVQLRAGIDEDGNISLEAQKRAIECLQRFGERIRGLPKSSVRIVGTNTLRVAKNSRAFLMKARTALDHTIEIITGEEEARLIYLGVSHALAFDQQRRFVMDIGGGSTEYIIGEGYRGIRRESLHMGCVSYSKAYFVEGKLTKQNMNVAILAASTQLRSIQRPYQRLGWVEAVGASGTIRCVAKIVNENGWSDEGVITHESLDKLIEAIIDAEHIDNLKLDGLSKERNSVIAGGVAVLKASFERLSIDRMTVSDGALREGLLHDMLGRLRHDDQREHTVNGLAQRYYVDEAHADRVAKMCIQFFEQVADAWGLEDDVDLPMLAWAAKVHEIGLVISHSQFHKHSAYMVGNSDLYGFSREEQAVLATLVRGQRKSFPVKDIAKLPDEWQQNAERLTILLRLAMVFNRGRSEITDTYVKLAVKKNGLALTLPERWLFDHPLTEADLQQEVEYLKAAKIKLSIQ